MHFKAAALTALVAIASPDASAAFGVANTRMTSSFMPQASRVASFTAHSCRAGDIAVSGRSTRRSKAALCMLLDNNGGIEELEELCKQEDGLSKSVRKTPKLFKLGGTAAIPAAAALGFLMTPSRRLAAHAVGSAITGVAGIIGKSRIDAATEAAAKPAIAQAIIDLGVDDDGLADAIADVKDTFGVEDEDFEEMCSDVYRRYLTGMVKNPIAKTGDLKELSQLRAALEMDNLGVGEAHASAAKEFYRQTCLFTPEEDLDDPGHPDRMSIDKFLFLSERAFRQAGETDEAFKFEMSRVAKAFKIQLDEALDRVAEVSEPFYRRALASTRSKLESGQVSSDMLRRARKSLGIDDVMASDLHISTFNDEIKELLGKDTEVEVDPASLKFPEGAMDRLNKLKEVLNLSDEEADYEIQNEATELFQAKALSMMEDAFAGIVGADAAWENMATRQSELCLKDDQMKTLLSAMVMQSLGKPLEETMTFAKVNNEAATYDKLVDCLHAKEVCKAVLSLSGWSEFDDFDAKFFDPWAPDSACGFLSPDKRMTLFKMFLRRSVIKSESKKELTDELYAKVMEVKGMLGVTDDQVEEEMKNQFGPELMTALQVATNEIIGDDYTPDLVKNLKEKVDKVISDYRLSDTLVMEYGANLYLKAVGVVSQNTPSGIPSKESSGALQGLRELLRLSEEDAYPAHLEVFGEVYKRSVLEAMGPTGVIRPEFREPLVDLRNRLGVTEDAARELYLAAVKERMVPMVEDLVLELERTMLDQQQLAQKRKKDFGEDVFKSGRSGSGKLGIGAEGYLMTDMMNLVDFYTENDVAEKKEVGTKTIQKKVMEGDEEKTVEEEVPDYETIYPITGLESGALEEEMAELLYRQFAVGAFTVQGPQGARFESSKELFGSIIGLSEEKMEEIGTSIGGQVYENLIRNSMMSKGSLDQQDMMMLANVQNKLGIAAEKGEEMLTDCQKKILSEEADALINNEGATPEILKAFREKCNSMGMELEADVGISKNRLVRMFEVEVSPGLMKGEITIESGEILGEIQESLGLSPEEAEKIFENLIEKQAKFTLGQIKGDFLRGRDDQIAPQIKRLATFSAFVNGEIDLDVDEPTAYKIVNLYDAFDFSEEDADTVESNKDALKIAMGLPVE
uniref:Uncharacterized protein n=1 Tax=Odontella aurita TaxID=265563 RepID=A0A7S4MJ83_9STRA|mmetsp:Transcript_23421/g.69326  ORF Transcript_23421/g.69326 Transcript_23421/m.69326 type:complete len:1139 (+) Transcript_23421:383-3799(+)|eukprot:CAMPEP_0113555362 /NCGR_PEP_ID=MMETSP0015_2-20120614/16671_1 /TAXON_ID=2838 /ORGANISM="Odontella" /LENGTH=1138 /DNA_ID=CAMNT_0000456623 /DNA_START=302 /DNA_END=3718 /DNA_ORIENTATION=- /assembly_acc=CAM_ASM_000160